MLCHPRESEDLASKKTVGNTCGLFRLFKRYWNSTLKAGTSPAFREETE